MANMFTGIETITLSSLSGGRVYEEMGESGGNVIVGVAWDIVGAQDVELQLRGGVPTNNIGGWEDTDVIWKTRERTGLIGGVLVGGSGPLANFWYQGLSYYVSAWCAGKPDAFIVQARLYHLQLGA